MLVPQPSPRPAKSPPRSILTLSADFKPWLEKHTRATVNRLDYHNPVTEWVGTARKVAGKVGEAFGQPVQKGLTAALRKNYQKLAKGSADTRNQWDTVKPTRDATAPNPGRPEYGAGKGQQHGGA